MSRFNKNKVKINLKSKKFRSIKILNKGKVNSLRTIFDFVKKMKNQISNEIFDNIELLPNDEYRNNIYKSGYKSYSKNNEFLRAWEVQKIYHRILEDYQISLKANNGDTTKIHCIKYKDGSFFRKAIDNGCVCSKILNNQNNTYSFIYKFKVKTLGDIYIPLQISDRYHDEDFFFEKDHLVSFSEIGGFEVIITYESNISYSSEPQINERSLAGIDVNIVSNLLSVVTYNDSFMMDIDRDHLSKKIEIVKNGINHKKGSKLNYLAVKTLRSIETDIKRLISELLNKLKELGVTDIVLEDLNIKKSNNTSKNNKYKVKYCLLARILRVSNIKNWIKVQANNRGLKVHSTNPSFTSQQCSSCGVIEKDNRSKQHFDCKTCGFKEHADLNAARNIRGRLLLSNVLINKLHKIEEGQYVSSKLNCGYLKVLLSSDLNNGVSGVA
ncbi:transposase [Vibrio parahaemolyticus]|nr:transposase [Vibrio parahaemolyticus]EJE8772502.1 transposase [Vibrio parahaemolyticus]